MLDAILLKMLVFKGTILFFINEFAIWVIISGLVEMLHIF